MSQNNGKLLAAAQGYLRRGFMPVYVPPGRKGPQHPGWQKLALAEADLPGWFDRPGNVGLLLGEASSGLVDIDLDCPEAVELADQFLPPTPAVTGRGGAPRSHRWYVAASAKTRQFRDPRTREMVVELRSTGGQTLVGPSIHPEGEAYEPLEGDPAHVPAPALEACVQALHEAVLKQRYGDEAPAEPSCTPPLPVASAPAAAPAPRTDTPRPGADDPAFVERRAVAYLDAMPPAVSGEGGHARAYAAATALVHGFGIDPGRALQLLLVHYNPRCQPPWSERDLRHKVDDASSKAHDRPPGWLLAQERREDGPVPDITAITAAFDTPSVPSQPDDAAGDPDDDGAVALGERDPATGRLVLSPKRTLPTAIAFVKEFYNHSRRHTICSWAGTLREWRGNHYADLETEALCNRLLPWLHEATRYVTNRRTGELELVPFEANPSTVNAALESVRAYTHLPASVTPPAWLTERVGQPDAREILACRTMNLHIPSGTTFPPTPELFTTNALDFDHDPHAPPPTEWLAFLDQLWGGDRESIDLLQEWFGYVLLLETSQQKMVLLVGPKRSGKGTIARILTRLAGTANVCGPTITGLAGPFGLQSLIGKSLAIVSDARFSGRDVNAVVERLLCISGEDMLTIERKYRDSITMRLPTRMMFLSNELPRLAETSGALAGRFLVLTLEQSFYGREDTGLTDRLLGELPGILLWALEGYRRLRERGRFVQPAASRSAVQDLEDLASPIAAFVRDCCETAPHRRVAVETLYAAWCDWCDSEGRQHVTTKASFGRDLRAAVPEVRRVRGGDLAYFYSGIGLR